MTQIIEKSTVEPDDSNVESTIVELDDSKTEPPTLEPDVTNPYEYYPTRNHYAKILLETEICMRGRI